MTIEVKVPMLPESIADATVSTWHKKVGDRVSRDENLVDLETDKVMLEVPAPADGVLKEIIKPNGETVKANEVIAIIGSGDGAEKSKDKDEDKSKDKKEKEEPVQQSADKPKEKTSEASSMGPSARRAAEEHSVDASQVKGTGKDGRVTKENIIQAKGQPSGTKANVTTTGGRQEKRVPMTRIRARIAERLLEVSQSTAMLTTFN